MDNRIVEVVMLGLIGKKLGMTRIFDENGLVIPVTVIQAGPCRVTQVKTAGTDGYEAIQVGFGGRKEKNITRPLKGHLARAGEGYCPGTLGEFRLPDASTYQPGQELTVEIFAVGEGVDVAGTTKGRGFAGVVKRHGFAGGDQGHGCDSKRVPGSVGSSAFPSRVWKNKRLPGHYGNVRQKALNHKVVKVDRERNYLFIRGAVPGPSNGLVTVLKKNAS